MRLVLGSSWGIRIPDYLSNPGTRREKPCYFSTVLQGMDPRAMTLSGIPNRVSISSITLLTDLEFLAGPRAESSMDSRRASTAHSSSKSRLVMIQFHPRAAVVRVVVTKALEGKQHLLTGFPLQDREDLIGFNLVLPDSQYSFCT